MQKILGLLLTAIVLFFPACNKNGGNSTKNVFYGRDIKTLADKVISGDEEANKKLKLYESSLLPIKSGYEKFLTDSLVIDHKKYYYLLLEFSDPVYNRLAIYNSSADLLLLDKSLNGEISLELVDKEEVKFLRAVESFLSKDIINLKRLSLYRIDTAKAALAMRTYITLVKPDAFLSQEMEVFTKDTITTNLILPSSITKMYAPADTFIYDKSFGKYLSKKNTFDSIVKSQVNDFNHQASAKP